jgi:hypothetical protein
MPGCYVSRDVGRDNVARSIGVRGIRRLRPFLQAHALSEQTYACLNCRSMMLTLALRYLVGDGPFAPSLRPVQEIQVAQIQR